MQEPMTSLQERILLVLPWAAVPLLAWRFVSIWNRLPQRMAVHFDLQGQANGWQSPETFAMVAFAVLCAVLASMTFALRRAVHHRSIWQAIALITYLSAATLVSVLWQLLNHAAFGTSTDSLWPVLLVVPIAALVVALIMLSFMRSQQVAPSPNGALLAEEQHRSLAQLTFVLPGLGIGGWLAIAANGIPRGIGVFLLAVMAWVAVAVLEGFRYLVRTDGVQIKGSLLPLHFIPRSSIRSYKLDRWRGIGYGIRLTTTGTAYIWGGKTMVNIATDSGDVMLGHRHPEQLIHDLDRMMQVRD